MDVHFSPDQEARLQDYAARNGKDAGQIVEEAVDRMLGKDADQVVEEGVDRTLRHGIRFSDIVEYLRSAARRGMSVFARTGDSTSGSVAIRVAAVVVVLA